MNLPEDKYDIVINPDGSGTFKPKAVDWSEWVPKEGEECWFIDCDGEAIESNWDGYGCDIERLKFGNVYPTEAMALAALPDIRRAMQIIRACRLVDPDFVPDWTDGQQRKYYIDVEHNTGVIVPEFTYWYQHAPAYIRTEESAGKVIALLERVK
jgi:hypothetical protein